MRWLEFIFNQLLNLVVGIIASLAATVLYALYREPLTSAVEECRFKLREYQRVIKEAIQLALLSFRLQSQAVLTSPETFRLVLLTLFVFAFLPILMLFTNGGKTPSNVTRNSILGPWAYQISRDMETSETKLHLLNNGIDVYSVDSRFVDLVLFQADGSSEVYPTYLDTSTGGDLNTKDITGDKLPDILLIRECGCSAGFKDYTLLSLDTEVREIFNLEGQKGQWRLDDLDGDLVPEIITDEFIADEGAQLQVTTVEIILKYENGTFNLASVLMKKPPPSESEFLNKIAQDRQSLDSAERSGPDASYIAKLVFSGNGELAHRYVNLVMSEEPENERGFYWSSIYGDMMGSDHWNEVASLNNWPPDKYAFKDCPY